MKKGEKTESRNDFFSNPKTVENYALLQDIGVFTYIDSLDLEINNYKNLFTGVLDIFNRNTINEIMEATVWQISDRFLPSIIIFIWKPMQNREDTTVKCYKNYKLVDPILQVDSISTFEPFLRKHPEPVRFKYFCSEINNDSSLKPLYTAEPELVVSILGLSEIYGMMLLGRNILGNEYSQNDLAFLQNLMSFVSKAIQNHLHYEQTLRDLKTGLYSNGFFMDRLNQEIIKARRSQTETSIIIIGVDHFKEINDTYGYLTGDMVLESLAIAIKQNVRVEDVPSRFGVEEFSVLLPETNKDLAWMVAERLRTMVETLKVTLEPPLPQVTVSLGVFTCTKKTNITANEAIKRAVDALSMSKEMGRNRTTALGSGLLNRIQHLETESIQKNKKP